MVKETIDRLEKKLEKIETNDLINSKFSELEKITTLQTESINRIENKLEKIETNDLHHVKEDAKILHDKLDKTDDKINEIEKEVSSNNGKLTIIISVVFATLAAIIGLAIAMVRSGKGI